MAELIRGEYFIDTDPGLGEATVFLSENAESYAGEFTIPVATLETLTPGLHYLGVRFQDSDSEWGQTILQSFDASLADNSDLAVGEYFINGDPGEGLATDFALNDSTNHGGALTLSPEILRDFPPGVLQVGIRVKYGAGEWGETVIKTVSNPVFDGLPVAEVNYRLLKGEAVDAEGGGAGLTRLALNDASPGDSFSLEVQGVDTAGNRGLKVYQPMTLSSLKEEFLARYFSEAEQLDELISGNLADPDGDGLTNLVELGLFLDPRKKDAAGGLVFRNQQLQFNSAGLLTFEADSGNFSLGPLHFDFYQGEDLVSWNQVEVGDGGLGQPAYQQKGDFSAVNSVEVPLPDAPNRFFKIEVSEEAQ